MPLDAKNLLFNLKNAETELDNAISNIQRMEFFLAIIRNNPQFYGQMKQELVSFNKKLIELTDLIQIISLN